MGAAFAFMGNHHRGEIKFSAKDAMNLFKNPMGFLKQVGKFLVQMATKFLPRVFVKLFNFGAQFFGVKLVPRVSYGTWLSVTLKSDTTFLRNVARIFVNAFKKIANALLPGRPFA